MRRTIYFARHAECKTNVDHLYDGEDILTEKGVEQAKALATCFRNISIEAIYTSNILRAKLTGKEIEAVTGLKRQTIEALKERKGSFSNEGMYEPLESFDDLKIRLVETKNVLEKIIDKHIVVISHAMFIKSFIAYLMLGDALTEDSLFKIVNALKIDNAALSKLVFNTEKSKWIIDWLNDQMHLFCIQEK